MASDFELELFAVIVWGYQEFIGHRRDFMEFLGVVQDKEDGRKLIEDFKNGKTTLMRPETIHLMGERYQLCKVKIEKHSDIFLRWIENLVAEKRQLEDKKDEPEDLFRGC